MSDAAVRILLFRLPRLVADLLAAAAGERRDVVLIDGGDVADEDLVTQTTASGADVVITSTAAAGWPCACAKLVVERRPVTVYGVDPQAGSTGTLESRGLGGLSPGELLVSAVSRAKAGA